MSDVSHLDPELPVTLTEAATLLGVPRSTLYRWAADMNRGAAPAHYIRGTSETGQVGIYRLSEVVEMVNRRQQRHADTAEKRVDGGL